MYFFNAPPIFYLKYSKVAEQILDAFINAGLNISTFEWHPGQTLIFHYLQQKDKKMIELLLTKKLDLSVKNNNGVFVCFIVNFTPLEIAKTLERSYVELFLPYQNDD